MFLFLLSVTTHSASEHKPLARGGDVNLHSRCLLQICINSPGSLALPNTIQQEPTGTASDSPCIAPIQPPRWETLSPLQCLHPTQQRPFAWTAEVDNQCLKKRLCEYVLQGREGKKEKEKVGMKRRGTKRSQEGENGSKRWRYMEIFRPLLMSEIQWQYPRNLAPLKLHSVPSPARLKSWTAAPKAGKSLPSPGQLHLIKQLCFP